MAPVSTAGGKAVSPARRRRENVRAIGPAGRAHAGALAAVPAGGRGVGLDRLYARYATLFLVVTLLAGVWLRTAFVAPAVLQGIPFARAVHAHSHLAFFGWTSMALFALLARRGGLGESAPWLRWHAHVTGAASAAVFIGFLAGGYNPWTVALSVVHVALWLAFASEAWGALARRDGVDRTFFRGALALLVLAGAGAMLPGLVMARGIDDPWIGEMAIQAFLTPFTAGWLMLGAMGAILTRLDSSRLTRAAFWLTVAGVLPSALLHTAITPPAGWLPLVGRVGTGLVGVGTLLFALEVIRASGLAPLLVLAGWAAAAKGLAEIVVAMGFGLDAIGVRSLMIGYLHLVLLGVVTPALIAVALSMPRAPRWAGLFAAGLALMLAALAALGVGPVLVALSGWGVTPLALYGCALAGGAACAAAAILLVAGGPETVSAAVRASPSYATATSTAIARKSRAR